MWKKSHAFKSNFTRRMHLNYMFLDSWLPFQLHCSNEKLAGNKIDFIVPEHVELI